MRIEVTVNTRDPGFTFKRFEEFTRPTGVHAYARAALKVAAGLLEQCAEGLNVEEKLVPDLDIECPAPPLFNALHRPTRTY